MHMTAGVIYDIIFKPLLVFRIINCVRVFFARLKTNNILNVHNVFGEILNKHHNIIQYCVAVRANHSRLGGTFSVGGVGGASRSDIIT